MIATIERPPRITDAEYMGNLKRRCRQLESDLQRERDLKCRFKELLIEISTHYNALIETVAKLEGLADD